MSVGSRMTTATTTVMHGEEMQDAMRRKVKRDAKERMEAEEELLVATATGMTAEGVVAAATSTRKHGSTPRAGSKGRKQPTAPRGFRDAARDQLKRDVGVESAVSAAKSKLTASQRAERDVAGLDSDDEEEGRPKRMGWYLDVPETPAQRSARLLQSLSDVESALANVKREYSSLERPGQSRGMSGGDGVGSTSPGTHSPGHAPRASPPPAPPRPGTSPSMSPLPLHQFVSAGSRAEATARDEATTSTVSAAQLAELTRRQARDTGSSTSPARHAAHMTGIELAAEQIRVLRAELLAAIQRHKAAEESAHETRKLLLDERRALQAQVAATLAGSRDAKARFQEAALALKAANKELGTELESERAKRMVLTGQLADMKAEASSLAGRLSGEQATLAQRREAAELVAHISGIMAPSEVGRAANQLKALRQQVEELTAALDLVRRQRNGMQSELRTLQEAMGREGDTRLLDELVIPALQDIILTLHEPVDERQFLLVEGTPSPPTSLVSPTAALEQAELEGGGQGGVTGTRFWLQQVKRAMDSRASALAAAASNAAAAQVASASSQAKAEAAAAAESAAAASDAMAGDLAAAKARVAELEGELSKSAAALAQAKADKASASKHAAAGRTNTKFLEQQLEDMRGKLRAAKADADKHLSGKRAADKAAKAAKEEAESLAAELRAAKEALAQTQGSSSDPEAQEQLQAARAEAAAALEAVERVTAELRAAEGSAQEAADAEAASASRIVALESEVQRLRDELEGSGALPEGALSAEEADALRAELDEAKAELEAGGALPEGALSAEDAAGLRAEVERLQQANSGMVSAREAEEAAAQAAAEARADAERATATAVEDAVAAATASARAKARVEADAALGDANARADHWLAEHEAAQGQLAKAKAALEAERGTVQTLQGALSDAEAQARELRAAVEEAKREAASSLAGAQVEMGRERKRRGTLAGQLRSARSSMLSVQASLSASQGTIVALVEQVIALRAAARGNLPPPAVPAPAAPGSGAGSVQRATGPARALLATDPGGVDTVTEAALGTLPREVVAAVAEALAPGGPDATVSALTFTMPSQGGPPGASPSPEAIASALQDSAQAAVSQ